LSPKRLGRVIKRFREAGEMGQRDLAKRAKVTQGYIAQLEAGDKTPSLGVLKRLAKALGVPVGELLE